MTPVATENTLPVRHVAEIEEQTRVPWLIDQLFLQSAVGILAGAPKSWKTWLALDLALSVATRTPVVGTYQVPAAGAVLLFAAEDTPQAVRARLSGMAAQRGLSLERAPIHLVLANSLRLDRHEDRERLEATVARFEPKLLVLDPFVRLSRIDENSSQEVSAVLAYLRSLQRQLGVSILVVHHTRKASTSDGRAGLALRGSGDFWAWSDSTLYLRRHDDAVQLLIEHRSAEDPSPISLELDTNAQHGPYLRVKHAAMETTTQSDKPLTERIIDYLAGVRVPCRLEIIRGALKVRMQTLVGELRQLEQQHRVRRDAKGWIVTLMKMPGETESSSAGMQLDKG
jgi:AAA domain